MKDYLMMLVPRFTTQWVAFKVAYWETHSDGSKEPHGIEAIALVEQLCEDDQEPQLVAQLKSFTWLGIMMGRVDQGVFFDWNEWLTFAIENGIIVTEDE